MEKMPAEKKIFFTKAPGSDLMNEWMEQRIPNQWFVHCLFIYVSIMRLANCTLMTMYSFPFLCWKFPGDTSLQTEGNSQFHASLLTKENIH